MRVNSIVPKQLWGPQKEGMKAAKETRARFALLQQRLEEIAVCDSEEAPIFIKQPKHKPPKAPKAAKQYQPKPKGKVVKSFRSIRNLY